MNELVNSYSKAVMTTLEPVIEVSVKATVEAAAPVIGPSRSSLKVKKVSFTHWKLLRRNGEISGCLCLNAS